MPIINLKQNNIIFKLQIRCFIDCIRNSLSSGDLLILQDMQRFAGASVDWTWAGAAPNIFSYLIRATNEMNERKKKLAAQGINVSNIGVKGFNLAQLKKKLGSDLAYEWIADFADEGFLTIYNPTNSKDPINVYVSLSPIWNYFMNSFQISGEEKDAFIESVGKLISIAVLTKKSIYNPGPLNKGGIPCGVSAFIPIMMIIQDASLNNKLIPQEKCEEYYARTKSVGRFSRIISHDNARTENQRMFDGVKGTNIEVKQELINAYKILQTLANNLFLSLQNGGTL